MAEEFLKYIPLDKSWIIRMGLLDLIHGYSNITEFLKAQKNLGDDLIALKSVAEDWNASTAFNVGESGTLYRFVRFYLWKNKIDRCIVADGSLRARIAESNASPEIIDWSLEDLLKIDGGTTQWASAAVINGNPERIPVPKYKDKLQLSYEAVDHWNARRKDNKCWVPRYDETIEKQARAFINYLKTGKMEFRIGHSEDYCFARAFNLITKEIGEERFPQIKHHESNRLQEMEEALEDAVKYKQVYSKDHRVIQAVVMERISAKQKVKVLNSDSVNKTWPQFWDFAEYSKQL